MLLQIITLLHCNELSVNIQVIKFESNQTSHRGYFDVKNYENATKVETS